MRTVNRAAALAATLSCILASAAPALALEPRERGQERASRQSNRETSQRDQVSLVLESVSPKIARPAPSSAATIRVTGTVTNKSGQPLPGLQVNLRYSASPAGSRGQVAQWASGSPGQLGGVADEQPLQQAAGAGGSQKFTITGNTASMGLSGFGAYPIGVEVTSNGQPVAGQTTFVTYVPKGKGFAAPLQVAWVWPIIGGVHRANDQNFMNDRLARDMAAGGRLSGLVGAASAAKREARTSSVTWAIDPALLDDAQAMTAKNGYTVRAPSRNAKATRRPQNKDAVNWLSALRETSKNEPFFNLPYSDPDAVALVRHKLGAHLTTAYNDSRAVNTQVLGRQPTVPVAWPPSGAAGKQTLTQLAKSAGLDPKTGAFLMSSREYQSQAQTLTPTAAARVPTDGGQMRAVIYDEGLSDIISGDTRSPGSALLVEQRFLAETAMITAESPTRRTLVVAPSRRWNPDPELAKRLLVYSAKADWLDERTSVSDTAAAAPGDAAFQGYSSAYERYELGELYLRDVQAIARRAATFRAILNPEVNPYQRAILRLESSHWRGRGPQAVQARTMVSNELKAEMEKVHVVVPTNDRVSVAGSSGRIPITIANDLRGRRVRFRFEVVSQSPGLQIGRLEPRDEQVIELDPGKKHTARIPVQASGNGNFKVRIQLYTPTGERGRAYGTGEDLTVRSTLYGRWALLITGGGLAVLFVGVGVRAMRARRRRKAEAAGDGSPGMGPAGTTGSPGTGFPGDGSGLPAESAFPSGPEFPGGTGLHTGPGTGSAPGSPGAGPAAGPWSGSEAGPGPASGAGPTAGAGSASSEAGTAGTGPTAGTGTEAWAGPAAGPGSEPRPGTGTGPAPGSGAEPEAGAGLPGASPSPGDGTAPGRWDGHQG
ncbi:DUF6049 family protein [Spirillospora sp. NPDC047279]|uniref:DUF6049 family protein n=1 Tax=Spirillospora sp. NPDC047279 TaxID=3155478 RepID=UPI0033D180A6